MKLQTKMCHTQLMSMLMVPAKFQRAITKFSSTAPDVDNEGFTGYMEVDVVFDIKDIQAFTELFQDSYVFPSDRVEFYHKLKNGRL
jgi:hypothetical protein